MRILPIAVSSVFLMSCTTADSRTDHPKPVGDCIVAENVSYAIGKTVVPLMKDLDESHDILFCTTAHFTGSMIGISGLIGNGGFKRDLEQRQCTYATGVNVLSMTVDNRSNVGMITTTFWCPNLSPQQLGSYAKWMDEPIVIDP